MRRLGSSRDKWVDREERQVGFRSFAIDLEFTVKRQEDG